MITKSDNTKGNPNHDSENGQFTSENGGGTKKEELNLDNSSFKKIETPTPSTPKIKISLKKGTDLADMLQRLEDESQLTKIPKLSSAKDIIAYLPEFFSKAVIKGIVKYFGKDPRIADYIFRPYGNSGPALGLFPCVIGKFRYKDNHAIILTEEEFNKRFDPYKFERIIRKNGSSSMSQNYDTIDAEGRYKPIVRGISASGVEDVKKQIDGYGIISKDNFGIYGTNCCFGTNIYTSVNISYSLGGYDRSYDGRYPQNGHMIRGILDIGGAHHMTSYEVENIQSDLRNKINVDNVRDVIYKNMENPDINFASQLARSFYNSVINDEGTVGVLLGLDYQESDRHQRNIYNLHRWIIKDNYTKNIGRYF